MAKFTRGFILMLLTLMMSVGLTIQAQDVPACDFPIGFDRLPENPVNTVSGRPLHASGAISDPYVMREGDDYRIWFTSTDWDSDNPPWTGGTYTMGTAYAETADGLIWDDEWVIPTDENRMVSLVLQPGEWDSHGVETVTVTRIPDDTFLLYYTGDQPPNGLTYAIGLATSTDGITWERVGDAPILAPEQDWEQPVCIDPPACETYFGGVLEPTVIYDENAGLYRLWYAAWGMQDDAFGYRMGYAVSEDGYTWERHPDPVFATGEFGAWDSAIVSHFHVVPDPLLGYHLFYFGVAPEQECNDCGMTPGSLGHAYSADGITWERNPNNPMVDWTVYGGPSALIEDGQFKLWYFTAESAQAANAFQFQIELATAVCEAQS